MVKTWFTRLVLLALLLAAGVWLWHVFFPSPERVIRERLDKLAQAASIVANEPPLAQVMNAEKLVSFFTADAQISVETPGHSVGTLNGKDDLRQAALGARKALAWLTVEFVGINLSLSPDKTMATADLTAKAQFPAEKGFEVQELKFYWKKVEGDWLVSRVETVRPLR